MVALVFAGAIACQSTPTDSSSATGPQGHWTLVSLTKGTGASTVPPGGAEFTADFGPDGRLSLRVDCNRCSGSYTSAERDLRVAADMACTLAACASAPFDRDYQTLLMDARSWVIEADQLELRSTTGQLRFRR